MARLHSKLKARSRTEGVSLCEVIRRALEKHVDIVISLLKKRPKTVARFLELAAAKAQRCPLWTGNPTAAHQAPCQGSSGRRKKCQIGCTSADGPVIHWPVW